jgi:hypothetical protein
MSVENSETTAPPVSEFRPDLNKNRSLWDMLQYTERHFTKEVTGKGRPMTDINPTWRMMRMTEMFGPCGKGWGWEVDREWEGETGGKKYAYVKLTLWWSDDNGVTKYRVGPYIGGTDMSQGKDEAYKQSVTDAFGKCASMLGVSADVYLQKWNDSKHHNIAAAEVEKQRNPEIKPERTDPDIDLSETGIKKFEADIKEKLLAVPDLKALDVFWRGGVNERVRKIGAADKAAQNRIISAFSQKKNELLKSEEGAKVPA